MRSPLTPAAALAGALALAACAELRDGAPVSSAVSAAAAECAELEALETTGAADALAAEVADEELALFREARRDLCARARDAAPLAPLADRLAERIAAPFRGL